METNSWTTASNIDVDFLIDVGSLEVYFNEQSARALDGILPTRRLYKASQRTRLMKKGEDSYFGRPCLRRGN